MESTQEHSGAEVLFLAWLLISRMAISSARGGSWTN